MKPIYVDFRAAARLLLREPGTPAPTDKVIVTSSTLLEIQLQRLLEAQRAAGVLSDVTYATKRREARAMLSVMHLFPMGDEVVELGRSEFPFAVSALGSLHVATAQLISQETRELEFWTHDATIAAAARHRGLSVHGVGHRA